MSSIRKQWNGAIVKMKGFSRYLVVLVLILSCTALLCPQSKAPNDRAGRIKDLNGIIQHIEVTDGAETIGGASVEDVVRELRDRTDFPISVEMLEFERPKDFVTLGEALTTLHKMQASGALGSRDQSRLDRYEEMAQTHEPSQILVARQRTFSLVQERVTVRDLLDHLVTLDDEYLWTNDGSEREPLVVIRPRANTALDWRVAPICHPRPIEIDELLAGCNGQECGPFTKLLNGHSTSVVYMLTGPVAPGEREPDIRPHGPVDMCEQGEDFVESGRD
jgi:hypothetical protein